jgi:hypothetical protein
MTTRAWIQWGAGIGAIGLALLVISPRELRAFTTIGHSLGLAQRDVRVFDNFTDPTANDNTTPDPNWPGYTGVELAVWKAVSEWGSELHGDGSGDPTQPFDIGSGGANFDVTWQGNATSPGSATDNVVSELLGASGGILSYTEYGSNGWRIRLSSEFTWSDGPGAPSGSGVDIQAIITHEYGHALGLGHSSVSGATMFPSFSGNGLNMRSIEADDKAGIQFIYGAKAATKPHVASASLAANVVTITGSNFDPTNNTVWFTRVGFNTTGDPVAASGVASTLGGTRIDLALPADAGSGDVLVLLPGASGDKLSNAYPFTSPYTPVVYCTAKTNSLGCTSAISSFGSLSASANSGFDVIGRQVLNNKSGLLFYGTSGPAAIAFQGGTLCVQPPIKRTSVQNSAGNPPPNDCSGVYTFDFNVYLASGVDPALVSGANVWLQYWSRDPGFAPPNNVGLTDALTVTIRP